MDAFTTPICRFLGFLGVDSLGSIFLYLIVLHHGGYYLPLIIGGKKNCYVHADFSCPPFLLVVELNCLVQNLETISKMHA